MRENERDANALQERLRASEERLRQAEGASGFATFEMDLASGSWDWGSQAALLFGLAPETTDPSFEAWERVIFVDDVQKIHAALQTAPQTGNCYFEFRVRHSDGSLHWIAGKGEVTTRGTASILRGAFYEITERKALEVRLLALNETLEARVAEVRQEARTLEVLNRTGVAIAAELDLERLVQIVTDAGVELCHA